MLEWVVPSADIKREIDGVVVRQPVLRDRITVVIEPKRGP